MAQPLARITPKKIAARADRDRGERDVGIAVLDFQSASAGLLATPVPRSASRIILVIASLVLACGLAMALIPVDKVVSAQGRLISVAPTIMVQPLDTSIVRSIDVHEGEVVHAGQRLARLDPTFSTADMGDSHEQVASLLAEIGRLRAELAGKPYQPADASPQTELQQAIYTQRQAAYAAKIDGYRQKISGLGAAVQRAAADVGAYQQRLVIASELERKRRELEKLQVGSQINRLQATDSRLEIARGLSDSKNQLQSAARDLQAQIAERDNFTQQWRAEAAQTLSDANRKYYDAQQQLTKAQLRHQLVDLRADQDATVLTVAHVSVGSVLQSGDQLITLVPLHSKLEAEANIAGDDAGYVTVGDKVMVKYNTFPYVKYGYSRGVVRVVSDDSFSEDQPNGARRSQPQAPDANRSGLFYRIKVRIDQVGLHDTPTGFQIKPGMPLTLDIKVGKRTVLTYLFSSVLPTLTDGMREP